MMMLMMMTTTMTCAGQRQGWKEGGGGGGRNTRRKDGHNKGAWGDVSSKRWPKNAGWLGNTSDERERERAREAKW
eukprot:3097481-Pyramimonas_sp.AAC.1